MAHTGTARFEGDAWDLASSVGATATMVAAARAMATRSEPALINDPFAEPLVRAVGVDLFTRLASGDLNPADLDDDAKAGVSRMSDNMAVRTKVLRRLLRRRDELGHQAGGHSRGRPGCPRLPAALAGRDGGL